MQWSSWFTWYKKPDFRDIKEYSTGISSGKRSFSPDSRSGAVPSQLRLERVLENKTCSPMSLYDFYMYLKHIEFSEENLEFYIWYKNYERNYLDEEQDDTSSSSSGSISSETYLMPDSPFDDEAAEHTISQIAQLISSGRTCARGSQCRLTCADRRKSGCAYIANGTATADSDAENRTKLNAIIQTFLMPGAPKELNIPHVLRVRALMDMKTSSHPSHLGPVADHVYQLLQSCSHRNFVRLGVSNGTFETICVATGLGIVLTIAGFMTALLLSFTPYRGSHSRWTIFSAWPLWWLGLSLILSGLRGSCFFLLLFSRRQPLPWERFTDEETGASQRTGLVRILSRLMIFDRKFRVKDLYLRRLQHKIVLQSLFGGAAFASIGAMLFIFLPVW